MAFITRRIFFMKVAAALISLPMARISVTRSAIKENTARSIDCFFGVRPETMVSIVD